MAIDFARVLSLEVERIPIISAAIEDLASFMEHLHMSTRRNFDELLTETGSSQIERQSWSPLLPGAWTNTPARRGSDLLSPVDLPSSAQRSSSPSARGFRDCRSSETLRSFAPPSLPASRQRVSAAAFDSKQINMGRGLRSVAAKLDLACNELQHRFRSANVVEGEAEREEDLLAVHDSIRSDLETLIRDWDESRVLLRSALRVDKPNRSPRPSSRQADLPESDLENIQDLDSDEPSLTHSTNGAKRSSSIFSSEAHTPSRSPPSSDTSALFPDGSFEETPTSFAPEQVFEAIAGLDKDATIKLSREERVRLAKEKRSAIVLKEDAQAPQPLLSGRSLFKTCYPC